VTPDFGALLKALHDARARFVVVDGMAMVSHGSAFVTADLDVCYDRSPANLEALAQALAPLHPRLRGAPPELPFVLDARSLKAGLNFTLTTDAGDLDLLGELSGVGGYEAVAPNSQAFTLYGLEVRIMGLSDLIRAKEAAGREKDRLHLRELREILKRRPPSGGGAGPA